MTSFTSIYDQWGFTESPFSQLALPASEVGHNLLVGREAEANMLLRRIHNPPKITTIEGPNGIGKTSLINVVAYRGLQYHLANKSNPLVIPCNQVFQLDSDDDLDRFLNEFYLRLAQTLLDWAKLLKHDRLMHSEQVERWINSPQFRSLEGGLQLFQFGVSSGSTPQPNTSDAFSRVGFRDLVEDWLKKIFPRQNSGGVVCTIDNLELLQSSRNAKRMLEKLRDKVLNLQGVRWVLCGSFGVILGLASSARLEGLLHEPLRIQGVEESYQDKVLASRIRAYAKPGQRTYLPLTAGDFETLYMVFRGNLRSVLGKLDDYCVQVAEAGKQPSSDSEKQQAFREWLLGHAGGVYDAIKGQLTPRCWEMFRAAVELGGEFSPSDYSLFGLNSMDALRRYIKDLEDVALVISIQDEDDRRRKTVQVTPKGWLAHFMWSEQQAH
jgi:hypothetical protein